MATSTITAIKQDASVPTIETLEFPSLPPFPSNIPIAPLHRLSLLSLLSNSASESERLFSASKSLGFFYLDLRSTPLGEELLACADELFSFAPELFNLGRDELQKYDYKSIGSYMGYKGFGSAVVDEEGNLDRNEFYNIPKDDILEVSSKPFKHPQIIWDHAPLIKQYIHLSHTICLHLLTHLEHHLHLPPLTLTNLHIQSHPSGNQVRIIKSPPQPPSDSRTALGKHTDFGSLTILFNRLGGLQILPPPALVPVGREPEWIYVKPLPGHCIVNLGDAMTKFTRGLLRSNIHRVVAPPGEQAGLVRWSLVYFLRPGDEIVLKGLNGGIIDQDEGVEEGREMTAKDWIEFQAMRLRKVKPDMGVDERRKMWQASGRGT